MEWAGGGDEGGGWEGNKGGGAEGGRYKTVQQLWVHTPSPKQPFSFLGRLAINSYLALCQQESDSVACGSAWLTVHSGG